MIIEMSAKVRLTEEEEKCLHKALDIINKIYYETCNCECEIEFEDDMCDVLDEMQSTIRNII